MSQFTTIPIVVEVSGARGPAGAGIDVVTPVEDRPGKLAQFIAGGDGRRLIAVEGGGADDELRGDIAQPEGSLLSGHRNKTVGDYLGLAYPPATALRMYGDSITAGFVGSGMDTTNRYATLLGAEVGVTPTVRAVAGGSIMDWMLLQYADVVSSGQVTTILPGFNDQRFVGESATFQAGYRAALAAAVSWAGIADADKIKAGDTRIQYFGSWSATPVAPYTFGRFSQTEGNALALPPVYGDTINLCMLLQNNFGGVVSIEVDGAIVRTVNLIGNGANGIALGNGGAVSSVTYAPRLIRIPGMGPGAHNVVIRKTDATTTNGGGAVHFLWADSGIRKSETQPTVLLGDTLTMNATGASSLSGYNNYTRLANAQFTQIARDVAAEAAADGVDVQMVDTHRAWSAVDNPSNDNVHPPISGHASIAAMFARAARGVKDYGAATAGRAAARKAEMIASDSGDLAPTLLNGWGNLDPNAYASATYARDGSGFVHLAGMISGGTATQHTPLFVLPTGFRPAKTIYFPVAVFDGAFGCVRVMSNGEVQIVSGNASWLSLNGIGFRASA